MYKKLTVDCILIRLNCLKARWEKIGFELIVSLLVAFYLYWKGRGDVVQDEVVLTNISIQDSGRSRFTSIVPSAFLNHFQQE